MTIQTYAHIRDLTPYEAIFDVLTLDGDKLNAEDEECRYTFEELVDDIREKGIKYRLKINPEGYVVNGNMRYWAARYLYLEENDSRFEYVPIEMEYHSGVLVHRGKNQVTNAEIHAIFGKLINLKEETISPKGEWSNYEHDTEDLRKLTTRYDMPPPEWDMFKLTNKFKEHIILFVNTNRNDNHE